MQKFRDYGTRSHIPYPEMVVGRSGDKTVVGRETEGLDGTGRVQVHHVLSSSRAKDTADGIPTSSKHISVARIFQCVRDGRYLYCPKRPAPGRHDPYLDFGFGKGADGMPLLQQRVRGSKRQSGVIDVGHGKTDDVESV